MMIVCSVLNLLDPYWGFCPQCGICLAVLNVALLYDRHFDDPIKKIDTEKWGIHIITSTTTQSTHIPMKALP